MAEAQIEIRPYRSGDADEVCAAVLESLEALAPWLPFAHPGYGAGDAREWVERCEQAFAEGVEYQFGIRDAAGRLLGGCGLNQINPMHRMANLGYWVRSSATGRGVATAAVRRLQRFAFERTDLVRLEIVCAVANEPSQRVAMKAGAVREAVLRDRLRSGEGSTDAVMFALLRSEWKGGGPA